MKKITILLLFFVMSFFSYASTSEDSGIFSKNDNNFFTKEKDAKESSSPENKTFDALNVLDDDYCEFEGTNSSYCIDEFVTTGGETNIDNPDSGYSPDGYEDATRMAVEQYTGGTICFSVTPSGTSTHGVNVWVDWNNDFDE